MNSSSTIPISVGIDVSKAELVVAVQYADRSDQLWSFGNTSEGITELINLLQKQRTAETVPCILESTGDFHLLPACMITQAGFMVKVINPLITKRYQQVSIRNAKNDTIDALRLATIGISEPDLPSFCAQEQIIIVRKCISYVAKLEKVKQQIKASTKQLTEGLAVFGGNIDLDAAKDSITSIEDQITELKKFIMASAPPEAEQLASSLRGVSTVSLAILLGALADKSFATRDQLVAFVGLDVMVRKSGTWQGRQRISKRGNAYLRKILYQIAWGLKQHHPVYRAYYQRLYREEGKHYNTAMIAVARKFLRFLFAYYWKKTISPQSIT